MKNKIEDLIRYMYTDFDDVDMDIEVIEILKKQLPMKPIDDKCPNCNSQNISTGYIDDWSEWIEITYSHCGDCHQALDWNEK